MPEVPDIAARVIALREARGWSQADLAYAADVTRSYMSRLESGDYREPSIWKLQRIARALDLSLDERVAIDPVPEAGRYLTADQAERLRPLARFGQATIHFLESVGEAFERQQTVRGEPAPGASSRPPRRRHRRRESNGSELSQA